MALLVVLLVTLGLATPTTALAQAADAPPFSCERATAMLTGTETPGVPGAERRWQAVPFRAGRPSGQATVERFERGGPTSGRYVSTVEGMADVIGAWSCASPGRLVITIAGVDHPRRIRFVRDGARLWYDGDTDPNTYFVADRSDGDADASSSSAATSAGVPQDPGVAAPDPNVLGGEAITAIDCEGLGRALVTGRTWHQLPVPGTDDQLRFRRDGTVARSRAGETRELLWQCTPEGLSFRADARATPTPPLRIVLADGDLQFSAGEDTWVSERHRDWPRHAREIARVATEARIAERIAAREARARERERAREARETTAARATARGAWEAMCGFSAREIVTSWTLCSQDYHCSGYITRGLGWNGANEADVRERLAEGPTARNVFLVGSYWPGAEVFQLVFGLPRARAALFADFVIHHAGLYGLGDRP